MLYQFVVVDYLVRRIGVTSPVNLYHKHPHLEKRLAPFSFIDIKTYGCVVPRPNNTATAHDNQLRTVHVPMPMRATEVHRNQTSYIPTTY